MAACRLSPIIAEGVILHHTKATMAAGAEPRRVTEPTLRLNPPGLEVEVGEAFGA